MHPVDALVNFFNPQAGLARVKARAQSSVVLNYDSASRGRRTYGWKAPATAADAAAYGQRPQLRQLSRDMIRNRPLAARAQSVVTGSVVGMGIMPSVHLPSGSDKAKSVIDEVIRSHLLSRDIDALGEHNFLGLQAIVMNTVFSDGEVFILRRIRDPRFAPGLKIPLQLELREADYLNTTITSNGQNHVMEGVEYGPTGSIEAYHFWNRHPGEVRIPLSGLQTTRWSAANVLHIRRCDRPGQLRGVPWLAPVMMTLGEISDYTEAQILKQRMAALLAGVITAAADGTPADTKALSDLAPGALVSVPEGSEVQWTTPPKVDGYGEFIKQAVAMIAVGVGITYESVSGDLSQVNFSSAQMGHMVMDRNVEIWQAMMVNQFCEGVEQWLIDAWRLQPDFPPKPFSLDWTAPRRPLINPRNDIPAMVEEMDSGLTSRQRKQRQLGLDPDTIRRERVEDMKLDAKVGLVPAQAVPAKPVPANQVSANPANADQGTM
ncbi:MAG: phage portal protein [Cypionkella sp.]